MRLFDDENMTAKVFEQYRMRNRKLIIVSTILSILLLFAIPLLIHYMLKQNGSRPTETVQNLLTSTMVLIRKANNSSPVIQSKSPLKICPTATWSTNGITVAGGPTAGFALNQFNIPVDMFVDSNDAIYIADSFNHRIVKWDEGANQGRLMAGEGGKGNQTDQLHYVTALFVDSQENIYVADNHNHRIQKWSKNSKTGQTIIGKFGRGSGLNQIDNCWGLYVDKKFNIYVSEHSNHRVTKWSPDAETGKIVAKVWKPIGIHVDETNDDLYVASYQDDSVLHFDKDGVLLHKIGKNYLDSPYDLVIMPGSNATNPTVIIADSEHHRILKMNMNNPNKMEIIAGITNQPGTDQKELNEPRRIRFDSKGNLLALDSNNHRVQKFLINNNECNSDLYNHL